MDCQTFQDLISAAVDRCLTRNEQAQFQEHADRCSPCRHDYEAESTLTAAVRRRIKPVKAPRSLARKITDQIALENNETDPAPEPWWSRLWQKPLTKPSLAFAVTFLVVGLILNTSRTNQSSVEKDVIAQSLSNFRALRAGTVKPEKESDQPELLKAFFSGKTDFPVLVPSLTRCTLMGGGANEVAGARTVHIFYRHDTTLIYMYQTCWNTVKKGEVLTLPDRAKAELAQTHWYVESQPGGDVVVVWAEGNTLCAVVAHMAKDELLACLTSDPTSHPEPW